ncbi:immunoglobulin-like and fibronectin type III domain-containing protein 1 isoform X1 [Columba livia]|uniref:immunoglobulin-like and fibronectin type III domain-containing protein 1 isoform X1 n=1 Tax=Columba livia TaxID=8932 RepID=UPI0031BAABA9
MTSQQAAKNFKKSAVPGVLITQFVDDIPEGCSTPDFERKPLTLTLQEGKNAVFRGVVTGVPTPAIKWTRIQGGMDDPAKYETFFDSVTREFVLQINNLTTKDSDLYRCFAVNEYGEASCSAGLRIIQVGFKRKAKYVPVHAADELKKKLQDSRRMLKKRTPLPKPKPLDKEAVWQLLLHADRRDYEKICLKYGIVDFRGMLRKLQELRKDTETEQGELIHSIKNFEHIRVNREGNATFSLEMDLKNSKSKVYLLKDGERLRYGTGDEYRKHCLRQIGKKYNFIVNDVQPEDAGVYQVRVEGVPVFSTELDVESIPVRFEKPLQDVRCPEEEDAVFECILRTPCYDAVWLHRTHPLEPSERHQISATPDGLTHKLVVKNVVPADNGMYTLDTGLCSSNAWLIVEYAKGKRRQDGGDEKEPSEWVKETSPDKDRAKKIRRRGYDGDEDHPMDTDEEKDGWYRNGQAGSQGGSVDESHIFLGKERLRRVEINEKTESGQVSEADLDGDAVISDGRIFGLKGGLRSVQGKNSVPGRADVDGKDGLPVGDDMIGVSFKRAGQVGAAPGRAGLGPHAAGQLDQEGKPGLMYGPDGLPAGDGYGAGGRLVGEMGALYGPDGLPAGAGIGGAGVAGAGGAGSPYGKDGLPVGAGLGGAGAGGFGSPYGRDGLPAGAGTGGPGAGRVGFPYGKDGLPAGGGAGVGGFGAAYGRDGLPAGAGIGGAGTGGAGFPYGKDGLPAGGGAGVAGVGGFGAPYGKDGLPAGADVAGAGGVGFPYGKDGLPAGAGVGEAGAGGFGASYGKDGLPVGAGVGGAGVAGAGGVGAPYGKDGLPAGAGVGGAGAAGAGGFGAPYGKDGLPVRAGLGGAGVTGAGGVGSPYGKDGLPAGAGIGGAGVAGVEGLGSPYGKDGLPAGGGIGGAGSGGLGSPYGIDGLPAGAGLGGAVAGGAGFPYGKDGLPAGAGVAGAGGFGAPYGKDGLPAGAGIGGAGVAGAGGVAYPYGKDGLPAGSGIGGAGVAGAGGVGYPYGQDGLPAGAGIGGAGVPGIGGVGSPYGKDGLPTGAGAGLAGVAGAGGVGSPYGKDGLPAGAGLGGIAGVGGVGAPYGKDGFPAGAGIGGAGVPGIGGVGSPYGKDGLPTGAGAGLAGAAGAGGVGSPYGKDGLPAGAGLGGIAGVGGVGAPYGKDGLPAGAGLGGAGVAGAGGFGFPYGKDGLPAGAGLGGAGVAGAGGVGSPYGKDGLPAGAGLGGAGVAGEGGVGSPYGKDGLPAGAGLGGAGVAGAGGVGFPHGKDGLPAGAGLGGAGVAGAGGVGFPYGMDGLPAGGGIGAGTGVGSPYGKDGVPAGAGVGGAGVAGAASPYGKDGLPAGAGIAGAGVAGAGGFGAPYGKDGLPAGAGLGGVAGAGGVGAPYGKDGLPTGAGIGGVAGEGVAGIPYGKDGLPAGVGLGGAGVAGAGGVGAPYGKDGLPAGAGVGGAGVAGAGGLGSPYGKDGLPAGAGFAGAGVAGAGGVGSPYGKDGLPAGAGLGGAGVAGAGGVGAPYGKDGLPAGAGLGGAGVAGAGGVGAPYGKDGLPAGAGLGGAGVAGAGGVGSPYGKDGVPAGAGLGVAGAGGAVASYGKDGLPAGVGAGVAGAGGVGSPYGKDGLPAGVGAGLAGVPGSGGAGSPYGKDGLPSAAGIAGAGVAGAGGAGAPYGKDGLPDGAAAGGAGVAGAGGVGSPYGIDGLPAGAGGAGAGGAGASYGKDGLPAGVGVGGAGVAVAGGAGSPYGRDGLPAGAGAGVAAAGGVGSPYGKDGLPAGAGLGSAGVAAAGGVGSPYGKDGLPAGARAGVAGAGGVGSPYGKDGLPAGAGLGGAGVAGAGEVGSPYGKDGLPASAGVAGAAGAGGVGSAYGRDGVPAGAGIGGAGAGGLGSPYGRDGVPAGAGAGGPGARGFGSFYGKDGLPAGSVAGAAHIPYGGEGAMGSYPGRDFMLSRAPGYIGGAGGDGFSSEGGGVGGSAIRSAGSAYDKDSGSGGARAGMAGVGRLGGGDRELHSVRGKDGAAGAAGRGGERGLDSRPGKASPGDEAGMGTARDLRGAESKGAAHDRDSVSGQDARGEGRDSGQLGSRYDKDSAWSRSHNRSVRGRSSGGVGQGPSDYGQVSDLYAGPPSINKKKGEPSFEMKANDLLKMPESTEKRKRYCLDDPKALRCYVNKQLLDIRVVKGEPAELSCAVSKPDVVGTWFKDGLKLTSMEGVVFEKEGLVHKLVINKVEDIHAGKYRFEGGDIKTEASIFVEDPPQVDKVVLKNLTSVPTVAKAGQPVKIKIPFQGRLPIRATWLKDKMELADDARIRVDKTDTFTMLSIPSSDRKDCGDYKVRLKNDSGVVEIDLKLVVVDKPQPPAGPIKIVESSANDITIQWNPPKDDGGKPLQRYVVERQQMGKNEWETLGETPKSCTTFTTNKVEQDMSYYFRVRAVNAEGTSDALESGEVKAVSKATPGAPDPPEVVSASKDTITIMWKAPRKTGSSRIVGYIVQKRKKGTVTWLPVNNTPVADKKLKMTNLKRGLQYEFRVAAVNAAGMGDASEPSQAVFARDSTKPPGQVQDLKVSSSNGTSITLTWKRPESKDGFDVKGYEVEMRSYNNLNWTKCNALPIEATTYTIKGLQAKETYFLRVRALNDSGAGEAAELEACVKDAPPVVAPRLLIDDTVKNLLVVKAGNTIRVTIPFEASPDPVVTWLKDGLSLSNRATINTENGTTQLLIGAAEFPDSGTYTIELQNSLGKRETFTFQVQVTDIPQPPGPIQLYENVPNTVTVAWEPSASEKWERDLYYTVLKRESQKGVWRVVGDLIYNNKFTFTKLIPGREYYFRVVAKNNLGASDPSETVQPWTIKKTKVEFQVKPQQYRGVNHKQPPRFLVPLKPHVVTTGSECRMSCAVGGCPPPKITWYKDSRDLSNDPTYFCTNDFGVCSLVVLGVTKHDEGEYMAEATNELGRTFCKAFLTIKDSTL